MLVSYGVVGEDRTQVSHGKHHKRCEEGNMYEAFYSLTNKPFNITPDPEFLYLSTTHAGALERILYGIERKRGLIVLTGESGTGKTTLLNTMVQRLDEKTHVAFVVHAQISPLDIYKPSVRSFF